MHTVLLGLTLRPSVEGNTPMTTPRYKTGDGLRMYGVWLAMVTAA